MPTASLMVEKAQNANSITFRIMSCLIFPDDEHQFAEMEEMFPLNLGFLLLISPVAADVKLVC